MEAQTQGGDRFCFSCFDILHTPVFATLGPYLKPRLGKRA